MKKRPFLVLLSVALLFIVAAVGAPAVYRWVESKWIYPLEYEEIITKYSEMYSVDKALICAVINCESGFDSEAVSPMGAVGLMQITPETFDWLQTKDDTDETLSADALYDPQINIKYGTLLLSLNIEEFGNTKTALASYNAGRSVVNRWLSDPQYSSDSVTLMNIPYVETAEYVERVLKNHSVYVKRLTAG